MNSLTKIIAAAAFAAVLSLSMAVAVQAADAMTMKPLHALSFNAEASCPEQAGACAPRNTILTPAVWVEVVATKHAVAYFLSDNGACKLVLTVAEAPDAEDVSKFVATRFEAAVKGGKATRFEAGLGKTLEFACQPDALTMTVKAVEQNADTAK